MTASTRYKATLLLALSSLALLKTGALEVCTAGRCHALGFDSQVLVQLHAWRTPLLDDFFAAVTWAGSDYVLLPLALLLAAIDTRAGSWPRRGFVLLALLSYWPVIQITKHLVARPRPSLYESLITLPGDGSFPSAHAAQITLFVGAWLLRPGRSFKPLPALALTFIAATVAVSRLYLQVHYPSDVLFAMAATLPWLLALRSLLLAVEDPATS
jgi:undecaprenyl-diphosphatase